MPRPDIVAMEDDKTLRDVEAPVLERDSSRVPVYHEDLDVGGHDLREERPEGTAPGQTTRL